jgi:hypothetical protein
MRSDLEPHAPEALIRLAGRLDRERPLPAAGFRGELRRRLLAQEQTPRPRRLRLLIAGYASSGLGLLLLAAASAAGLGPLAA